MQIWPLSMSMDIVSPIFSSGTTLCAIETHSLRWHDHLPSTHPIIVYPKGYLFSFSQGGETNIPFIFVKDSLQMDSLFRTVSLWRGNHIDRSLISPKIDRSFFVSFSSLQVWWSVACVSMQITGNCFKFVLVCKIIALKTLHHVFEWPTTSL